MEYKHFVIDSSISLSRNVSGYPFPAKLQDDRFHAIESSVFDAVNSKGKFRLLPTNKNLIDVAVLADRARLSYAVQNEECASVIASADENEVITINYKDHVKIRVFAKGFDLKKAYANAEKLDNLIGSRVKYSYSGKLGYLTSSPTNVGTGMRASVTLFLPGLERINKIKELANLVSRSSLKLVQKKVDELKIPSSYELSSVYTLGVTEHDIIEEITNAVDSIGKMEEKARAEYYKARQMQFKDEAQRSYGLATNCYLLSNEELQSLIASIRLGAYYNVLPIADVSLLDTIASAYSVNAIIAERKGTFKQTDIDAYRAIKVKDAIKSL